MLGCVKEDSNRFVTNLNEPIGILGHGGMGVGSVYPMNSQKSIERCLTIFADGTELDVQITEDSILVAYKSNYWEEKTNCTGALSETYWDDKNMCFYKGLGKHKVLSLDELFTDLQGMQEKLFVFDVKIDSLKKNDSFYATFAKAIVKFINRNQLKNVIIESQEVPFLLKVRELNQNLNLYLYPVTFSEGFQLCKDHHLDGLTIASSDVTKEDVLMVQEAGFKIAVWNVNSKSENREALEKGPDFIQTDNLSYLLRLREVR